MFASFVVEKWLTKRPFMPKSVVPTDPGYQSFECQSADQCLIKGWSFHQPGLTDGTLVWLHGFGGNASLWAPEWLFNIRQKQSKLSSAAFDFRGHGRSQYKTPTLGVAEKWDCAAVLDTLETHDFPKPFILIGESMGAMVAGHVALEDERVAGAICMMAPAAPLIAAHSILPEWAVAKLRELATRDYQRDILLEGDLTFRDCSPAHQPTMMYVHGERDPYHWSKTLAVWEHWYRGNADEPFLSPSQAPGQQKFFLKPPCGHDLSPWQERYEVIDDFIRLALARARGN